MTSHIVVCNGPGAAAVLATGIGSLVLAVLALASDASSAVAHMLNLWKPTGPLSGVTDLAILAWLAVWVALARRWRERNVDMRRMGAAAATMGLAGMLLCFPPLMDLLQGK